MATSTIQSVVDGKIQYVGYDFDNFSKRQSDVVVDPSGNGDYITIAAAVDAGETNIFLHSGTHLVTTVIEFVEGTIIRGGNSVDTIIVFSGVGQFVIDGSDSPKQTTGTISVVDGFSNGKVVTGSGTSFTNLTGARNNISIKGLYFAVDTVSNNTSLTLLKEHQGGTESGLSYVAQSMYVGFTLSDVTLYGALTYPLYISNVIGITLSNVIVDSCFRGIYIQESSLLTFYNIFIQNINDDEATSSCHAIELTNIFVGKLSNVICANNRGSGLIITSSDYTNINIADCFFIDNIGDGLKIFSGENYNIANSFFVGNRGNGVEAICEQITINSCLFDSNKAHQLDLNNADRVTVSSCHVYGNQNGQTAILTGGDGCIINNKLYECSSGVQLSGNNVQVINNIIEDMTTSGILQSSTGSSVVRHQIIGNIIRGCPVGITYTTTSGSTENNIIKDNIFNNNTTDTVLSDTFVKSVLGDYITHSFYLDDPTTTANFIDGIRYIQELSYIESIYITLEQRGDTGGSTEVDVLVIDTTGLVVGTTQFNKTPTTLYTTVSKPTIVGDTATSTQNAFLLATLPDITLLQKGYSIAINLTDVTTSSKGLRVDIITRQVVV